MSAWVRLSRRTVLMGAVLGLVGCAGMGPMADVLMAGTGSSEVRGEVRRVDERNRTIQVGSSFGSSNIRYDGRTRVTENGRSVSIRNLSRGDRVSVQVRRNDRGDLYARRIQVERGSRSGGRADDRRHASVQYVEGRVNRVDQRAGWVEVRPNRGSAVRVHLPNRPSNAQVRSFNRLRRGDHVRLQGRPIGGNRMELVRIL